MLTRRDFIKRTGIAAAGFIIADNVIAFPLKQLFEVTENRRLIRVNGIVRVGGIGAQNIPVTDGISVIGTSADGTFQLVTDTNQNYIYLSLPAGANIPVNPTGTALFYKKVKSNGKDEIDVEFELSKNNMPNSKHTLLALADPQMKDLDDVKRFHSETIPDLIQTIKRTGRESTFSIALGDIMYNNLELFPLYEKGIDMLGIPAFQVVGNHDIDMNNKSDALSTITFQKHFGPAYYSFNRGEIHYVIMDDVFWTGDGYIGYIPQYQLDWLKADLSFVEKGRRVVVCTHIPIYNKQHERHDVEKPRQNVVVLNREALYKILEPYKVLMISGHMHESEYLTDHGFDIHVCGAVCGAWWTGNICHEGTPSGYTIYSADGSDLSWQYKGVGKDISDQINLFKASDDSSIPNHVIANVWAYNPEWEVIWFEDGIKKGEMKRWLGKDPVSVKLMEGDDIPKKHPWIEPLYSDHLFIAEPSAEVKEIIVEATDNWGRKYSKRLKLI